MKLLANESTPEGAAKKVTARLGKPTWIEGGKKRIWIAKDGNPAIASSSTATVRPTSRRRPPPSGAC